MLREQWIKHKILNKYMQIKSEQKHVLISPRKVRPVADVVRKMSPLVALEKLPFIKKRGSEFILKVLKSALASAKERGLDLNRLVFKEVQITEGPRLKRGQPVSRGRWHAIKKRMSHIRIILETINLAEPKVEKEESGKKVSKVVKSELKSKEIKSKKTKKQTVAVKSKRKEDKNVTKN